MEGEQPTPEHQAPQIEPKIYVASLSDYNNGHLHGRWINAAQEAATIQEEIEIMLEASRQPEGSEEWAIHDYEGFGAFQLGEYEDVAVVALIAAGIVEHGPAFGHWANLVGTWDVDRLSHFEDHYRGVWDSLGDYASDVLDDMGASVESFTPGWLRPYVSLDLEALGSDLATELEVAHDRDGQIHIFEPNA